jgi:hypothetical protein
MRNAMSEILTRREVGKVLLTTVCHGFRAKRQVGTRPALSLVSPNGGVPRLSGGSVAAFWSRAPTRPRPLFKLTAKASCHGLCATQACLRASIADRLPAEDAAGAITPLVAGQYPSNRERGWVNHFGTCTTGVAQRALHSCCRCSSRFSRLSTFRRLPRCVSVTARVCAAGHDSEAACTKQRLAISKSPLAAFVSPASYFVSAEGEQG